MFNQVEPVVKYYVKGYNRIEVSLSTPGSDARLLVPAVDSVTSTARNNPQPAASPTPFFQYNQIGHSAASILDDQTAITDPTATQPPQNPADPKRSKKESLINRLVMSEIIARGPVDCECSQTLALLTLINLTRSCVGSRRTTTSPMGKT
jgi:hypothetical protein